MYSEYNNLSRQLTVPLIVSRIVDYIEIACNWIAYRRLCTVLPNDVIVRLLSAPNADGLRPLECAANDGILGLAKAYLLTRGMYIIREEDRGLATYQWIDVTDYETFDAGNRKEWAPLFCLTLMDKDRLNYPTTAQLFADPVIRKWIKNKIKCGILPAVVNMVMRCFMVGIFIVIDSDIGVNDNNILSSNVSDSDIANAANTNSSVSCKSFEGLSLSPHAKYLLCICLIMHSVMSHAVSFIESCTYRPRNYNLPRMTDRGYKNMFVQHSFYRRVHGMVSIMIGLRAVITLMRYTAQSKPRHLRACGQQIVTVVVVALLYSTLTGTRPVCGGHSERTRHSLSVLPRVFIVPV